MCQFRTFREESKRFHVIRVAHLTTNAPTCLHDVTSARHAYEGYLDLSEPIKDHIGLQFDVQSVCYLNPADVGRLGGVSLPVFIGRSFQCYMVPLTVSLCMTLDESIDEALRKELAFTDPQSAFRVEPLSWFGYGQFRRCVDAARCRSAFRYAMVFFQKRKLANLSDFESVFEGLQPVLRIPGDTLAVSALGLFRGNVDGFILYQNVRDDDFYDGLASWLCQSTADDPFWSNTSPVVVYYGGHTRVLRGATFDLLKAHKLADAPQAAEASGAR